MSGINRSLLALTVWRFSFPPHNMSRSRCNKRFRTVSLLDQARTTGHSEEAVEAAGESGMVAESAATGRYQWHIEPFNTHHMIWKLV